MASVLGGLSMGIGACMCICLACYRMIEPTEPLEESVLRRYTESRCCLVLSWLNVQKIAQVYSLYCVKYH